jgi:hypothetical protein
MKQPTVELQIDELILRNVPYAQRHHIAAAVEQALTRLLTEQGVPQSLAQGGYIPQVSVDHIQVTPDAKAGVIGGQIAQSLYSNLSDNKAQG